MLVLATTFSMLANNASATTFTGVPGATGTTSTTIGGANFKVSTGVTLVATVNGTNTGFSVASKHVSGDKTYQATSLNPSVVEVAGPAVGTATPTAIAAP